MVFFFQNYSCASKWRTKWGKTCFNYNVAEKIACVLIKRACQWFSVLEEERGWKKNGSLEQKRVKKEVELTWTGIIGLWLRPCPGVVGLNKMGAEPSGCGRCARFLTDREQRKVNKRIQHRWRFQSIGYSLSLKGLGCGHPLCARLPCSAHHACGRRCQGEFNLIVFSTFAKMSNSFVWNRFSCGNT